MRKFLCLVLVVLLSLPAYAALDFKDLKFTGHYRLRGYYTEKDGADTTLDRYYRQRIWLGVEGNVAENVFANVTMEFEKEWGKNNATPESPTATLVYGYVKLSKLFDKDLTLTVGRQPYQLNKNNFVIWDNANGLDGMRLTCASVKDWTFDALYFKVNSDTPAADGDKDDQEVYGAVANYKGIEKNNIQAYLLFDRNDSDLAQYIGLRGEGAITSIDGLSYIAELILLSGDSGAVAKTKYRSSLYYLNANYEIKDLKNLKFIADYLVASGDNVTDDKNKNFKISSVAGNQNLEGNFNFDFGMDAARAKIGADLYSNVEILGFGVSVKPTEKLALGTKYSMLNKNKVEAGKSDDYDGKNLDIFGKYDLGKTYYVAAGYSMFDPDKGKKTTFLGAELRVNF